MFEATQPAALDHAAIKTIVLGVLLAMLLAALDQTIVATALPTIGRDLGDLEHLPWVVTAYLLTSTAVTPLYGKFSDIHGRRVTLLIGIGTFMVGSIACAARAHHAAADPGAGAAGPRRRRPDLARPDDHRRRRGAQGARPLPGLYRQRLRHLERRRPGARRLLRRAPALVGDLLDQPAARRCSPSG